MCVSVFELCVCVYLIYVCMSELCGVCIRMFECVFECPRFAHHIVISSSGQNIFRTSLCQYLQTVICMAS